MVAEEVFACKQTASQDLADGWKSTSPNCKQMGLDLIFFIVQTGATGLPCTLSYISTVQRYIFPTTYARVDVIFRVTFNYFIIFPQRGCIMLTSPLKSRDKAKISRFRYFLSPLKSRDKAKISRFRYFFWKWLIFTLQWYTKFRQNAKLLPKFGAYWLSVSYGFPKICKNFGANNC